MIVDLPTPCFGKSHLFDSTIPADHEEAKKLCNTCDMLNTCTSELEAARKLAHPGGGPEGTWAGKLVGNRPHRSFTVEELAAQDAAYTDDEMRQANAQWKAGDRTDWVLIGHRVYERSRKRRAKNRPTAA